MAGDTKDRILDVAERLFADFGLPSTSLRDITSEAGVNLASVNYHFGSKEALLVAVLERRFRPVNQRRVERLEELERLAGPRGAEVEAILRAFIAPPFEIQADRGEGGVKFVRLLGRIHSETNDDFRADFVNMFNKVFRRFTTALQKALPEIDPAELDWRMWFLIGSMAHTMMWRESFCSDPRHTRDPEEMVESLVQFGAAGMAMPSRQTMKVPVRASRSNA